MADKLIRGIDNEVWTEFALLAKTMRMTISQLLTLVLREHLENNKSTNLNSRENKILDLAFSLKEHQITMNLARLLSQKVVNNALEDFTGLELKHEGDLVLFKRTDGWYKLFDYGLNKKFDGLNQKEKKAFLFLLLENMTNTLTFIGKDTLSQIKY